MGISQVAEELLELVLVGIWVTIEAKEVDGGVIGVCGEIFRDI